MSRPRGLLATLFAALALGACGSDSEPHTETSRPIERLDSLPRLPAGWGVHVNPSGGFAFALPPGWQARDSGTYTVVRSFDRLVAVSVGADRTREALTLPLGEFATRTLLALQGFEGELDPSEPRQLPHRYDAVAVEAEGTAERSGVAQRVQLVVMRRGGLATITVAIAANAIPAATPSELIAERMVETLRSRPVGGGV